MTKTYVKIAVFVPEDHADAMRDALGEAGAGKLHGSNYSFCSFSTKGIGRFLPGKDAEPHTGKVGEITEVIEERIETICDRDILPKVLAVMKAAHPYEEVAHDIWALEIVE